MELFDELKELGVNVEEGLERVMGDAPLYETMLGMFIDRVECNPIAAEDFAAQDLEDLTGRVHALKGVTGNLAMAPLFAGYLHMLELLRAGRAGEAKAEYERILPVQAAVMDCIRPHGSAS